MDIICNNVFQHFIETNRVNSVQLCQTKQNSSCSIHCQPENDEFVKNITEPCLTREIAEIQKTPEEKYIEHLYDEVYDESMALMPPIVQELSIKKPQIKCDDDNTKTAAYSFMDNEITFYNNLMKENIYLCYVPYGSKNICLNFVMESNLRDEIMSMGMPKDYQFVKLNDEEKELYIKSVIAHELRHCVQSHLTYSCDGLRDELKKVYDDNNTELINLLNQQITLYEKFQKEGIDVDSEGNRVIDELTQCKEEQKKLSNAYYKTYKPKRVLDENTMLKYHLTSDNNKPLYLSVKEHLLPGIKNQVKMRSEDKENAGIYYSYPHEVDAYTFEALFLKEKAKSTTGVRENIVKDLLVFILSKSDEGFNSLEKNGYKPFCKKTNGLISIYRWFDYFGKAHCKKI